MLQGSRIMSARSALFVWFATLVSIAFCQSTFKVFHNTLDPTEFGKNGGAILNATGKGYVNALTLCLRFQECTQMYFMLPNDVIFVSSITVCCLGSCGLACPWHPDEYCRLEEYAYWWRALAANAWSRNERKPIQFWIPSYKNNIQLLHSTITWC